MVAPQVIRIIQCHPGLFLIQLTDHQLVPRMDQFSLHVLAVGVQQHIVPDPELGRVFCKRKDPGSDVSHRQASELLFPFLNFKAVEFKDVPCGGSKLPVDEFENVNGCDGGCDGCLRHRVLTLWFALP